MNNEKIDEAVLALLYVGAHENDKRSWKSFDWDAMERLHEKGYISNPAGRAKSVAFTDEGWERSREAFQRLFCNDD